MTYAAPIQTLPDQHQARVATSIGKNGRMLAEVRITSHGLLAIGGLVSAILLSTAVLVAVAASTPAARKSS